MRCPIDGEQVTKTPPLYWTANGKRKITMKITTLTFDANLPTTQQVNVPTNTDYKVGMKVKRNGEIQQLGPDEFTIYTGEINVIPPEQYTSDSKTCENGTDTNLITLKEADLSAMAG